MAENLKFVLSFSVVIDSLTLSRTKWTRFSNNIII